MKGICKLCLQEKELINSHIIPEGFFRFIKQDEAYLLNIPQSGYKGKSMIGVYDDTILCDDCEKMFNQCDEYSQKIFINNVNQFVEVNDKGRLVGYILNECDYFKLKMFFISVLWRAGVSSRKEFVDIKLGRYENILKKMILDKNPGEDDDFSVIIEMINDRNFDIGKRSWFTPIRDRKGNVNVYKFWLGAGVKFIIKVDKMNFVDNNIRAIMLQNNNKLCVISYDFLKEDLQYMKEILQNPLIK